MFERDFEKIKITFEFNNMHLIIKNSLKKSTRLNVFLFSFFVCAKIKPKVKYLMCENEFSFEVSVYIYTYIFLVQQM